MSEKTTIENIENQVNKYIKQYVNLPDKKHSNELLNLIENIADLIDVYGVYYVPENSDKNLIQLMFVVNSKLQTDSKLALISEYFDLDSFKDTIDENLFDNIIDSSESILYLDEVNYRLNPNSNGLKKIIFTLFKSKDVNMHFNENNLISLKGNKLIHFYDKKSIIKNEVYSLENSELQGVNCCNLSELNIEYNSFKNRVKINVKNFYNLIINLKMNGLFEEEDGVRFISFLLNNSVFQIEINTLANALQSMMLLGWKTTILSTINSAKPMDVIFTDFNKNKEIYNENFILIKTVRASGNTMIFNLNENNFEYLIK